MAESIPVKHFKLKRFITKWTNYEYWPWLFFYLPAIPVHLWYALRSGYLFYNTAANPGIDKGGLFGESKIDILNQFEDKYKPKTYNHKASYDIASTIQALKNEGFEWPLILKPNIGERGLNVEKVADINEVAHTLSNHPTDYIIQEYINYDFEFGVLYGRLPNEESGTVRSITIKGFLKVIGDGKTTVEDLLYKNKRAWFQIERLKAEKPDLLNKIAEVNEVIIIEPIGNHCRGTEFIDGNHLLSNKLDIIFDGIAKQFNGFYYGRFDLKAKSIEQFMNGESIKLFELNGVTSEPGHIYDHRYTLLKAYRDIFKEMHFAFEVSKLNIRNGHKPQNTWFVLKLLFHHFKNK
jgi:hypothetical protein